MKDTDDTWLRLKLPSGRTVEEELRTVRALARLLDTRFEIAGQRFGIDAIVGLVPVAGDGVTLLTGFMAVFTAVRLRLPPWVIAGLIWNLLVDAGLGAVPVIGDVFDFFFRSHKRNFRMLEKAAIRRARRYADRAASDDTRQISVGARSG